MTEKAKNDDLQTEDVRSSEAAAASGNSEDVERVSVLDEETGEEVKFEVKKNSTAESAAEITEVNVKANISTEDYYIAHVNHIFYRRGIVKAAMVFAAMIFLDILVRYYVYGREYISFLHVILVILTAVVVSIGLPVGLKSQIGKAYEKNIFYCRHMRFSINEKRVAIASKSKGKKIPWDKFKYIKQTDDFFLFVVDGTHAAILPIRVLTGVQIQAIRNFILKSTAGNKKIKVKLP